TDDVRAGAGDLETERGAYRHHPRVWPQASVAVEDAATRTNNVLHVRLNHPPRRQLRLVHHLDHGFPASHRVEKVSESSDVGIKLPRALPDLGICRGNSDLVVGSTRYEAFVKQATVGIEIDQIAIVRHAARTNKCRQALV